MGSPISAGKFTLPALERMLRYASRLKVPSIVTENGIATYDDQKKIRFIRGTSIPWKNVASTASM